MRSNYNCVLFNDTASEPQSGSHRKQSQSIKCRALSSLILCLVQSSDIEAPLLSVPLSNMFLSLHLVPFSHIFLPTFFDHCILFLNVGFLHFCHSCSFHSLCLHDSILLFLTLPLVCFRSLALSCRSWGVLTLFLSCSLHFSRLVVSFVSSRL